jgi:CheY-like chemotaxis protein
LLDAIRRASTRLINTIEGILDISKMETRTLEVKPAPLGLPALIQRVLDEIRASVERSHVSLSCGIEERRAVVLCDEYCLTRSLSNLLSNAIKFTPEGEVEIRLYRNADGVLSIDVRDTGVGIDPSYLPRLFEPFTQEDSGYTRQFEGSGLGLALTKRYLDLNGASIAVKSEKGRGSTFTIQFPRQIELSAPPAAPQDAVAPALAAPAADDGRKPAILVVEDDADSRAYMKRILEGHYEVLEATSAQEVRRQLAARSDTRMILMDLSLQGKEDGLMITRDLRKDPRWKDLPIIATTAHAFAEDHAKALAAGCNSFLAKPIHHQALLSIMQRLLARGTG